MFQHGGRTLVVALCVALGVAGCSEDLALDSVAWQCQEQAQCGPGFVCLNGFCVPEGAIGADQGPSDEPDEGSELETDPGPGPDPGPADMGPDPGDDAGPDVEADADLPCVPDCVGKQCGDDGCGGSCGACADVEESCSDAGTCEFVGFAQVSVAEDHACALTAAGTLRCWPDVPDVPGGAGWQAVAAGQGADCAIAADGVYCFNGSSLFVEGAGWTQVSNAGGVMCARDDADGLSCWDLASQLPVPVDVDLGEAESVIWVSNRAELVCGVTPEGELACSADLTPPAETWAAVDLSEIGVCGLSAGAEAHCWPYAGGGAASINPGLSSLVQVEAGGEEACARHTDGVISCWPAWSAEGEASTPPGGAGHLDLSLGTFAGCAVQADGNLVCWGEGEWLSQVPCFPACAGKDCGPDGCGGVCGECVAPDACTAAGLCCAPDCSGKICGDDGCGGSCGSCAPGESCSEAGDVCAFEGYQDVAGGGDFSCAINADSEIFCWGSNANAVISDAPTDGGYTRLAAGSYHVCALKESGQVHCWGDNQFGEGSPPPGTFKGLSAGNGYTCGVTSEDFATCWGDGGGGKLGAPAGVKVEQVSVAHNYGCALTALGAIQCWGYNGFGQGNPPGNLGEVVAIAAGHVGRPCALDVDGTVTCWGNGTTSINGQTGVVDIAEGAPCLRFADGTVTCDGQNPPAGTTFVKLGTGYQHSCGVRTDGNIVCWGNDSNNSGKLLAPCFPVCGDKACGDDGCGTETCGTCAEGEACFESQCCVPDCEGKQCGDDGCGGECGSGCPGAAPYCVAFACAAEPCLEGCAGQQCGCPDSQLCFEGSCCNPKCNGKNCGSDGCGGSCGECEGVPCEANGQCCVPSCEGKECGDDGCGGTCPDTCVDAAPYCVDYICSLDPCPAGCEGEQCGCDDALVCFEGACCEAQCDGKECGDDSCGGSCGTCEGVPCEADGLCCVPDCAGKTCGDDGCGGSCGACPDLYGFCDGEQVCQTIELKQISVGATHVCALRDDQSVVCWGADDYGQATPAPGTYLAVSAGYRHSCALRTDQGVTCWGDDSSGEVSFAPSSTDFTHVVAGFQRSCAAKADGSITCWGATTGDATPPNLGEPLLALDASDSSLGGSTCALGESGTLRCWSQPVEAPLWPASGDLMAQGASAMAVGSSAGLSLGRGRVCGVTDGYLSCLEGSINESTTTAWLRYYLTEDELPVSEVALGPEHVCALRVDGRIECFGYNLNKLNFEPANYVALDGGGYGFCALTAGGRVRCWGNSTAEQQPFPSGGECAPNCPLGSCGDDGCGGTCAGCPDGESCFSGSCCVPQCEGKVCGWDGCGGSCGSCGFLEECAAGGEACEWVGASSVWVQDAVFVIRADGKTVSNNPQFQPRPVEYTQLEAGHNKVCGLLAADSTVECYGRVDASMNGLRPPGDTFAKVSVGAESCGLTTSGAVKCWSERWDNWWYDMSPYIFPWQDPGGTFNDFTMAPPYSNYGFACGATASGVECWPENHNLTLPSGSFVEIDTYNGINSRYGCVRTGGGAVQCFHYSNDEGQLDVPGTLTFDMLGVGNLFGCARRADTQTVVCWGNDDAAGPAEQIAQFSCGTQGCCGVELDGTVQCWGGNAHFDAPCSSTEECACFRIINGGKTCW